LHQLQPQLLSAIQKVALALDLQGPTDIEGTA
jgi:hypothetical protein